MARWWTSFFDKVWDHIVLEEPATTTAGKAWDSDVLQAVEAARREWLTAKMYFDSVTDPDLIDHAIYSIEAAERKYMYLLRKAKDRGYSVAVQALKELKSETPATMKTHV